VSRGFLLSEENHCEQSSFVVPCIGNQRCVDGSG
jgi:hypothetical protein